jgi:hypothetical protein
MLPPWVSSSWLVLILISPPCPRLSVLVEIWLFVVTLNLSPAKMSICPAFPLLLAVPKMPLFSPTRLMYSEAVMVIVPA